MRKALLALLLVTALGCAARDGRGADLPSDEYAASTIAGLPAPLLPLGATSLPFQDLWLAGDAALDVALAPSEVADEAAFADWVERNLTPFLGRRADALREIERQKRRLPPERIEERVMAEALFGLVLEQTARPVLEAAVPVTVARPGREVELRRALDEGVHGLVEGASGAYRRCLVLTRGAPPHLAAWRQHCVERAQQLPDVPISQGSHAASPGL